jgi:class 3 adenylate cyclase/tetratricopeptide (TPR) repeat protein
VLICASCGRETPEGFPRCANCGAELVGPAGREVRKTVTVLFCDLAGSTALGERTDPEALRALLARYFERMKAIVERHGGTVEKFIGDAVMAVFGVPQVHEDDALRACRAAVEMRDALPELGLQGRIGVNTGEVVTGTEERLATGDAVNVAARLEQAARPGEVLIGARTLSLVGSAVEVEPVEALSLKGKAEPVAAFRLLAAAGELERRFATPMVGRERELRRLRDAFAQAVHDRSCQLFTVLGTAGVGKSRLAAEFLAGAEAQVLRGRCLSYGEGITYWPIVEILKQSGVLPDGDAARPLQALLGASDQVASAEEIAWGFRELLEQHAQSEPVVCVLDDVHWAEDTLLDLVEHVADLSRDAPILLLCMARPELLERRPSWGGGKWNATTVLLEPLDAGETEQLLGELGGVTDALRERIVQAAEGNPLFLEEMLALVRDSRDGTVEVPATIQALLAARLDQLDPAERSVLERGSVEGRIFHRGAVAALSDEDGQVDRRLVALVRKELVRPDRPQLPREDAYRFRHLLIRDAAYDALPKAVRAELHQRFAAWLEQNGQELVELEEILGHHLEQAAHYLAELGRPDPTLAEQAAGTLAAAGVRARLRGDFRAARSLLARSLALDERPDVHLLVHYAAVEDSRVAAVLLDDAARRANLESDPAGAALARAVAAEMRLQTLELSVDETERLQLEALSLLEAAGDHDGLAEIWNSLASGVYNVRCRYDQIEHAAEEALRHAALAGRPTGPGPLTIALQFGGRPVPEALTRIDELATTYSHPGLTLGRAVLLAMNGEIDAARTLALAAAERFRELSDSSYPEMALAQIEELAGNFDASAELLRSACARLAERGQDAMLGTYAPWRGRILCALGRYDEAEQLAQHGREAGDEDDPITQALWRSVSALVQAQRESGAQAAERLAREALDHARKTDSPHFQADTLTDLAQVLEAAGRREEAAATLHDALELYERKQLIPLVRHTRERLAALQPVET